MMYVYHLHFHDPVHFGIEGIGQESVEQALRSDSLWGAILQKWFLLFDDEPDQLCIETPFSITSCFPFIGGTRYFPLPVGALDGVLEGVAGMVQRPGQASVKDWRKVQYVAEPLFRKILVGKSLRLADMDLAQVYPMKHPAEKRLSERAFQQQEQRPRLMSDQLNGGVKEGSFFYCTDQFFEPGSGLFFLADFVSEAAKDQFEAALYLLGDSGVGADRSIGRGGFSFTSEQIDFASTNKPEFWIALSLYHPTREEIAKGVLQGGVYSLQKRSGAGGSFQVNRFRRADCWMLAEGALLPFQAKGDTPCVLPRSEHIPHNVYRNGKAFCIPLQRGA